MKIVVIGAGIGGIAIAGRLARAGHQVMVFEKNATPGGRVQVIQKDGFRFDTGPTLFLMPEVYRETYEALGEKMENHLELVSIDPTYRIHFHDGTHLDLSHNLLSMRAQLEAMEAGAFAKFLEFMAEGYRHYTLSLQKFVGRNFYSYLDYFSPRNLPLLFQLKALTKHAQNITRYFRDPRLQAAFSFQNMYLGLSPYDAPATYSLLQYTELGEGVWFPKGGMYRAIETLVKIVEGLGVRFEYNAPVQEIRVNGRHAEELS
jgi:Phytoene dehydrogenase and related proteins